LPGYWAGQKSGVSKGEQVVYFLESAFFKSRICTKNKLKGHSKVRMHPSVVERGIDIGQRWNIF